MVVITDADNRKLKLSVLANSIQTTTRLVSSSAVSVSSLYRWHCFSCKRYWNIILSAVSIHSLDQLLKNACRPKSKLHFFPLSFSHSLRLSLFVVFLYTEFFQVFLPHLSSFIHFYCIVLAQCSLNFTRLHYSQWNPIFINSADEWKILIVKTESSNMLLINDKWLPSHKLYSRKSWSIRMSRVNRISLTTAQWPIDWKILALHFIASINTHTQILTHMQLSIIKRKSFERRK